MKLRNKKTGEIKDTWYKDICINFGDCNKVFHSLSELNEEWEDYKPAEPLIKDEKIRKAVRAWADVMEIETVEFDEYWQSFRRDNSTICFRDIDDYFFKYLEDGKDYTIAELCGEEE